MEAGNRCFDLRVPEEINRKIVDHLSDINLTYTEHARRYLLAEGVSPELIIKTGSPMLEVINFYSLDIDKSNVVSRLGLENQKYLQQLTKYILEETIKIRKKDLILLNKNSPIFSSIRDIDFEKHYLKK